MSEQRFLEKIFRRAPQKRSDEIGDQVIPQNGVTLTLQALRSNRISAGGVTVDSSLQVAAVWAAVGLISETIGELPLFIYEDVNGEKTRAKDHPLYTLLHNSPNPQMTAIEFRSILQSHLLLWGNAYAQIIYDESGRPVELWPMRPDRMIEVKIKNGRKYFTYQDENNKQKTFSDATVWHIHGFGYNGVIGHSPIWLARHTIGLSLDAQSFGEKFFSNDARPGFAIEHPNQLSEPAYNRLKEDLDEEHTGIENSHRPMILEEGMKLHEVGIPPEDAQFLETRKFQVREIARIFHVPPHKIGDLEQATFSNIEHQSIEFVQDCILPWTVRWEQSIWLHLLLPSERQRFYAEHLLDGLLRGDTLSRYQAYGVGMQWGFLVKNDIRRRENMNLLPDGDRVMVPMNYTFQDLIGKSVGQAKQTNSDRNEPDEEFEKRLSETVNVLFSEVMGRVLKRESQDLKILAKKTLSERGDSESFSSGVRSIYEDLENWLERQIYPVFQAFSILRGVEPGNIAENCHHFATLYGQRGIESWAECVKSAQNGNENLSESVNQKIDDLKESRVKVYFLKNGSELLFN